MGFKKELFPDPNVDDEFICALCQEVLQDPVMIENCEHIHCKTCLAKWLKISATCPRDRNPLRPDWALRPPPRPFLNALNGLRRRCQFECGATFSLDETSSHEESCSANSSRNRRTSPRAPGSTRNPGQNEPAPQGDQTLRNAAKIGGAGAAAGVAVPVVATTGLSAAGFGSGGIVAGSLAAGMQGPAVAAGSWFATFQSIGATGGFAILGPVGVGAAVVGAGVAGGWLYYRNRSRNRGLAPGANQNLTDDNAGGAHPGETRSDEDEED